MRCACTHADAGECMDRRSNYDMAVMLDPDLPMSSGEECSCSCHEERDEDFTDDEIDDYANFCDEEDAKEARMKTTKEGPHIVEGEFQSDKYPTTPRGKVPLSVKDKTAQDLLWMYAGRRRAVDGEFADDLEACLRACGYEPGLPTGHAEHHRLTAEIAELRKTLQEIVFISETYDKARFVVHSSRGMGDIELLARAALEKKA